MFRDRQWLSHGLAAGLGRKPRGWAVCQTHLIIYWVREAEPNWALEKLLPWYQMYMREGDVWKTFKGCAWHLVGNGTQRHRGEWAGPGGAWPSDCTGRCKESKRRMGGQVTDPGHCNPTCQAWRSPLPTGAEAVSHIFPILPKGFPPHPGFPVRGESGDLPACITNGQGW